jgi:hypothetical protein
MTRTSYSPDTLLEADLEGRMTRSVFKTLDLMASHARLVKPWVADQRALGLASSETNMSIRKEMVPMQLRRIKVFECLARWPLVLCHVALPARTDHIWEKPLARQTEQGLNPSPKKPRMLRTWHMMPTVISTRLDGDPWGLNPDLLVEMKDNSIGDESRCSRPDYNHPRMLHLSDRYTNSRGRRDLVEHDNPAMRAPVLQAIEELARRSRTSTELRDDYEVY